MGKEIKYQKEDSQQKKNAWKPAQRPLLNITRLEFTLNQMKSA